VLVNWESLTGGAQARGPRTELLGINLKDDLTFYSDFHASW
jgi:hypothetical protein